MADQKVVEAGSLGKIPTTLRVAGTVQAAELSVDEEGEDIALDLIAPAGAIRMMFTWDETLDLLRLLGTVVRRRLVGMNAANWGGDLDGDLLVQRSA
jgi:hypothetical protein